MLPAIGRGGGQLLSQRTIAFCAEPVAGQRFPVLGPDLDRVQIERVRAPQSLLPSFVENESADALRVRRTPFIRLSGGRTHATSLRRRNTARGCAQVAPGRRLLVTSVSSEGWKTLTLCVAGVVRMYCARVLFRKAPTLSMLK